MRVLMVCLGNICRSPLAQGVLENLSREQDLDWYVDSAGTSNWHAGEAPDPRAIQCARSYGMDIRQQRSRQVTLADFERFDWLLAMDKSNFQHLQQMAPKGTLHKVRLLMEYWPDAPVKEVPDPYYNDAFDEAYQLIRKACQHLIAQFEPEPAQDPLQ
jgi:protein-tyrosine phosphatase